MLTFYNWRIKRSGAGLRIIGDAILGDPLGVSHADLTRNHKISNVGAIELMPDGKIMAHDRDGKIVARLSPNRLVPGANK